MTHDRILSTTVLYDTHYNVIYFCMSVNFIFSYIYFTDIYHEIELMHSIQKDLRAQDKLVEILLTGNRLVAIN